MVFNLLQYIIPKISISFHRHNPAREQFAADAVYALRFHAFE